MRLERTKNAVLPLITILLAMSFVSLSCGAPIPPLPSVEELATTQIRVYQGQELSSIEDFRENSIQGPRYVDAASYRLAITGLVGSETTLTYEQVLGEFEAHQRVATLDCEEGWGVTLLWEGVLVRDLLDRAGVLPDAKIVIFRSVDGYSTSLLLDYLYENDIMLAHKMNEVVLPAELGFPFQVVAEGKWGYKWIKWVDEIEVSDDELYEGYWESRGFSDNANLDQPFLDQS